jgi:pyruvate/2-oxoglutarate dehydrogenase complex dihydrolipoamide dehydrogenase (E3) component
VGLELAQVFARFGAEVTVLEALDRLLPVEEPEAGELLAQVLRREGIVVHTGARIESVVHRDGGFTVTVGDGVGAVRAEQLLVATGRRTDLVALGVGAVGLDESARFLTTDRRLRVAEGVWAVGDVTGRGHSPTSPCTSP